jgi:hypothetical protein
MLVWALTFPARLELVGVLSLLINLGIGHSICPTGRCSHRLHLASGPFLEGCVCVGYKTCYCDKDIGIMLYDIPAAATPFVASCNILFPALI